MNYQVSDLFIARAGAYIGQMFIVMEMGEVIKCFTLPTNTVHHIPKDAFERGCEDGMIDKAETLPEVHFNVIKELYEEHIKEHRGSSNPIESSKVC